MMLRKLRFPFAFGLAILLGVSSVNANAQSPSTYFCEKQAISMKAISVKRLQPGKIALEVELENAANVAYRFIEPSMGKSTQLIDDQGETWVLDSRGGSIYNHKNLLVGGKLKLTYPFKKDIGGNEAKQANITGRMAVFPSQQKGYFGECVFEFRNLLIE